MAGSEGKTYGFILHPLPGYLQFHIVGNFKKGDQVNMSYKEGGTNSKMILGYGAAAIGNLDNEVVLTLPESQLDSVHNFTTEFPWRKQM